MFYLVGCGRGWFVFTKMESSLVVEPSLPGGLSSHLPSASQGKSSKSSSHNVFVYQKKHMLKDVFSFYNLNSPNPDESEWSVFIGPRPVNGSEVFDMSLPVARIILSQNANVNIALMRLTKPVSFQDYIQPVCMDTNNVRSFPVGTRCWVAGWQKDNVDRGKISHLLSYCLLQV